ncbi:TetR family transcriptional regulator C-terminal domain-containing protein [Geomicrobium sp. JCM 19055]|uniref:TetR family transcriptional regulator C-terminal domain-containing protein n=1 Tax=Geomicrobium sp. JCM 19055 TaxID=1460649 RepID=UPI00351C63F7
MHGKKIHRSQASATEKLIMIADYLTEEDQSSLSFSIPQFIEESSKRSAEQRFTLKELNEEIIIPEINVFNTIIEDGINTGEFDDELDVSEVSIMLYSSLTSMSLMNHYLPDDTDIKSVVNNFMNRMITTMKT